MSTPHEIWLLILLLLKCLWYNQRLIIYPLGFAHLKRLLHPGVRRPHVRYQDIELVTKDKVKLRCYLIPHSSLTSLRGTVILFHGNAMNHGDLVEPHAVTFHRLGFTVLTAEYRGYGFSEGTPSESGLQRDAQAAFDFISNHPELSKSPIVIYGQSLGGAVAIDVTSRNADKISALIIENAFTSIPNIVRQWRMGWFLSLLTTQKWWSASKVAQMPPSLPILMLSGLRDTVVPPSEMVELWKVAKMRPKNTTVKGWLWSTLGWKGDEENLIQPEHDIFETFPFGGHNDTSRQYEYWPTISKFLDDVVPSGSKMITFHRCDDRALYLSAFL